MCYIKVFLLSLLFTIVGCNTPFHTEGDPFEGMDVRGALCEYHINNYSENAIVVKSNIVRFDDTRITKFTAPQYTLEALLSDSESKLISSTNRSYEFIFEFYSGEEYTMIAWNIDDYYENDINVDGLSWMECESENNCSILRKDTNGTIVKYVYNEDLQLNYQVNIYNENNISVKFIKENLK